MEQVVFKIDKKLKERAMRKAKQEGITYSDVLRVATEAFIDDQFSVGFVYSPKIIKDVLDSKRDIMKGGIYKGNLRKLVKIKI